MAWPRALGAFLIVASTTLAFTAPISAAPAFSKPVTSPATLSGFVVADQEKLLAYKSITRSSSFKREGRRYMSGISYQVVDIAADELFALLQQVDRTLPKALPATHKARYVGNFGSLPLVEVVHGNGLWNKGYTVIWQPVQERHEVLFWLSNSQPHDVEDVWGFFRITEIEPGRSLVTVAVALDLGKDSVKALYEDKVQQVILKSARYFRKFVDRRHGKTVE